MAKNPVSGTADTKRAAMTPGDNEVVVRLSREAAEAFHAHINGGIALEDGMKDTLGKALDTGWDNRASTDPVEAGHEDEVIVLMPHGGLSMARKALQGQGDLDVGTRNDLAHRLSSAVSAGQSAKSKDEDSDA